MKYLSHSLETTIPQLSTLQSNNCNSDVQLPNCYIRVIYRDIHHFIGVIYYSWVDDVKDT